MGFKRPLVPIHDGVSSSMVCHLGMYCKSKELCTRFLSQSSRFPYLPPFPYPIPRHQVLTPHLAQRPRGTHSLRRPWLLCRLVE